MSDDQQHRELSGDEINELLDAVMVRELGEPGSARAEAALQQLVDSDVIQTTRLDDPADLGEGSATSG